MSLIDSYPNDKSTIFSIVPIQIGPEFKPGIYPGSFTIEACKDEDKPMRLIVGASEHLSHIGGRVEPLRQITPSYMIAQSVIQDWLSGQLWTDEESRPGLAWLAGTVDLPTFLSIHQDIHRRMKVEQHNWFKRIYQETEDDYNRYHSYKVVSAQARIAAQFFGKEPEWLLVDIAAMQSLRCPACSTPNQPENAICSNCRCILSKEKYEKLTFAGTF